MALIVTAGAANADSYVSVAEATTLLRAQFSIPTWEAATQPELEAVLRRATALLGLLVTWDGALTATTQALAFPRTGLFDPEGREVNGASIPSWLQQATAEYANELLQQGTESGRLDGIRAMSVDGVSLTFDSGGNLGAEGQLPSSVLRLVARYTSRGSRYGRLTAVRS
jgi:hypothetical protein